MRPLGEPAQPLATAATLPKPDDSGEMDATLAVERLGRKFQKLVTRFARSLLSKPMSRIERGFVGLRRCGWLSSAALALGLFVSVAVAACSDDEGDAEVEYCEPEGACSCMEGVERETACTCNGGSTCEIEGNSIEFQCQGNAGCGMSCGDDCLITCPGTTSCDIDVGNRAEINCPGTASCNVSCRGSCSLQMAGAARALLTCEDPDADCTMDGCRAEDCGDGVFACGMDCPADDDAD